MYFFPDDAYFNWLVDRSAQKSKMLYIFHVDTGTMMTFDMNLAMERYVCTSCDQF